VDLRAPGIDGHCEIRVLSKDEDPPFVWIRRVEKRKVDAVELAAGPWCYEVSPFRAAHRRDVTRTPRPLAAGVARPWSWPTSGPLPALANGWSAERRRTMYRPIGTTSIFWPWVPYKWAVPGST